MKETVNQSKSDSILRKYLCAVIVFSSAMLATWTLGESFSVGGFTSMEITLLVIFSSIVLKVATAFWNAVIDLTEQLLRIEPLTIKKANQ